MNYYDQQGLSFSAMKDLAISPMRFWWRHLSGTAPERKESAEMRFGTAVHCAVLEPERFSYDYARAFEPSGGVKWLDTVAEIKTALAEIGAKTTGTKPELIERLLSIDPDAPIVSHREHMHAVENSNKIILPCDDYDRAVQCAASISGEPSVQAILSQGDPEVAMFARDPETDVLLKCKADWVSPVCTFDLKTFSLQRGGSVDQEVFDAIWYRRYYWQAYTYMLIRSLQPGEKPAHKQVFTFAFVESEPPFEVRLQEIRASQCPLLWERAKYEVHNMIRTYARHIERFGGNPWREPAQINVVIDEEVRQLAFS